MDAEFFEKCKAVAREALAEGGLDLREFAAFGDEATAREIQQRAAALPKDKDAMIGDLHVSADAVAWASDLENMLTLSAATRAVLAEMGFDYSVISPIITKEM